MSHNDYVRDLLRHEFGLILQLRKSYVGLAKFYSIIATESAASASMNGIGGQRHSNFWTETWANNLALRHFGNSFSNPLEFPSLPLSPSNFMKFFNNPLPNIPSY